MKGLNIFPSLTSNLIIRQFNAVLCLFDSKMCPGGKHITQGRNTRPHYQIKHIKQTKLKAIKITYRQKSDKRKLSHKLILEGNYKNSTLLATIFCHPYHIFRRITEPSNTLMLPIHYKTLLKHVIKNDLVRRFKS